MALLQGKVVMASNWSKEEERLYDIYVAAIGTDTEARTRDAWMAARREYVEQLQRKG